MSYPMYEFLTDSNIPGRPGEKWIAQSAAAVGTVCHRAGHEVYSAMNRGRECYLQARMRIGKDMSSAHSAVSAHPYVSLMIGVGVGAVVGYIASSRMGNKGE